MGLRKQELGRDGSNIYKIRMLDFCWERWYRMCLVELSSCRAIENPRGIDTAGAMLIYEISIINITIMRSPKRVQKIMLAECWLYRR